MRHTPSVKEVLSTGEQHGDKRDHDEDDGNGNRRLIEGLFQTATGAIDAGVATEDAARAATLCLQDDEHNKKNTNDDLCNQNKCGHGSAR